MRRRRRCGFVFPPVFIEGACQRLVICTAIQREAAVHKTTTTTTTTTGAAAAAVAFTVTAAAVK